MSRAPIPEFTNDLVSIAATVRALKEAVEEFSATRPGQGLGVPRVFVGPKAPDTRLGNQISKGDFWVNTLTNRLSYHTGQRWLELGP